VIALQRLAEPAVLAENGEAWQERFLEKLKGSPGQRPDPRQYGHREIRNTLRAVSFQKCFYCERKLSESEDEIDHYIEVAESPEQAFAWENLVLCCRDCNRKKLSNATLPVRECLNPCDMTVDPADHLTFADEIIRPRSGSPIGARTIQKYRLERDQLNYLRTKQLQQFERFVRGLQTVCIGEGRRLTQAEKEAIASFGQTDHEFSLMFRTYLTFVHLL
jgi:uncharacterized protein (TIGR02646 family)